MANRQVYIITSRKNKTELDHVTEVLESRGFTVWNFVREAKLIETEAYEQGRVEEWIEDEYGYGNYKCFQGAEEIGNSDLAIYIGPSGHDSWAQVGIAWATGIPIYAIVGADEPLGLMRHLFTARSATLADCLAEIGKSF